MTVRRQDAAGGRQRDDRTTTGIRREGEKRKPGGTLPQKRCRAQRASELSGKLLGRTSGRGASCYHNRTTPDMFQFFKFFFGSRVRMRHARQAALELRWRAGGQAGRRVRRAQIDLAPSKNKTKHKVGDDARSR